MEKLRNKFERNRVYTEPGSPIKIKYAAKYDKDQNIVIEKKGTESLYSYINSFADSVDINVLISRFVNGDKEALMQRAGSYLDLENVPTNINEFMDFQRSTENLFKTLPVEIKEQFNNNVMEFMANVGSKEWLKIMDTSEYDVKKLASDVSKDTAEIHQKNIKPIENPAVDVKPETIDIEKAGK